MESPQGLAAVESPITRLRLTSTKTGRAPIVAWLLPGEQRGSEPDQACEPDETAQPSGISHAQQPGEAEAADTHRARPGSAVSAYKERRNP